MPIDLYSKERATYRRKCIPSFMLPQVRIAHPNRRIVLASGCFDLLHVGHTDLIADCSENGDMVVIGINSDESVKRLKGPERPIISDRHRAQMLCNLAAVNWVFTFGDTDVSEHMRALRPDVYVLGEESIYDGKPELIAASELGIDVVISRGKNEQPYSTTSIIHSLQT